MKILEEYQLSDKDWNELTKAIQSIQSDIISTRNWEIKIWLGTWLDGDGVKRSEAIREINNERKREII